MQHVIELLDASYRPGESATARASPPALPRGRARPSPPPRPLSSPARGGQQDPEKREGVHGGSEF